MRSAARAATLVAALAIAPGCSETGGQAPEPVPGAPRILLTTSPAGQRTIEVAGLAAADLAHLERAALSREAWQAVLRVQVAQADPAPAELPPVLGDHVVRDGVLRFTPQFPFDPGQRYEVVFDPSSLPSARGGSAPTPRAPLRATVEVSAPDRAPSTRVVAVYPHRSRGAGEPSPPVRRLLGPDGPGRWRRARPAARRARPARGRPVPAAGRRSVELGPHALHGSLRPRARQARHPAERRAGPPAGGGAHVHPGDRRGLARRRRSAAGGAVPPGVQGGSAPGARPRSRRLAARPPGTRHARPSRGTLSGVAGLRPAATRAPRGNRGAAGRWPGRSGWSGGRRAGPSRRPRRGGRASIDSSRRRPSRTSRATASGGRSRSTRRGPKAPSAPAAR